MNLSTTEQQKSYENAYICYIFLKTFEDQYAKDKKCCKFRDHYHYVGECRGAVPKEIFIIFHNGNIEYWINTNIASLR